MVDEDKLKDLKERIQTANSNNSTLSKKKNESGAGFGFKISTEIIAALVGKSRFLIILLYTRP